MEAADIEDAQDEVNECFGPGNYCGLEVLDSEVVDIESLETFI